MAFWMTQQRDKRDTDKENGVKKTNKKKSIPLFYY